MGSLAWRDRDVGTTLVLLEYGASGRKARHVQGWLLRLAERNSR